MDQDDPRDDQNGRANEQEDPRDEQHVQAREGEGSRVLGIVAEPDMPTQVGTRLAAQLTDWLDENAGGEWTIEVVSEPLTAGLTDRETLLQNMESYRAEREWVYAICLTDLPVLLRHRPLIASVYPSRSVALVSLPALGGMQPYRRMRQMLIQLLEEFQHGGERATAASSNHRLYSWLTNALAPVHRTSSDGEEGVLYTANRASGWLRLLSGMVRTNRPWRLIFGLSRALVAAIATSAFGLSSSTIWQLADSLPAARQVLAVLFSVGLLVFWLIAAHGLWERRGDTGANRLRLLYNSSTAITLSIGVAGLYLGLFLVNLAVATILVPASVLSSTLQHPDFVSTYVNLAWGFTTMGAVAGALGSSLESDRAVRQAAYGYREQQRRAQHSDDSDRSG
ncbi:hypothetical protein [Bounagaea algeriensis]